MGWETALGAIGSSLIGGGLSFLGGQSTAASQAALAREQMQTQADLQRELATRNEYLQQLFASNQLQWRAQDARNAGIHPLFAMGAQPISASGLAGSISPPGLPTASGHEAWQQMGQDVARAVLAHGDSEERKAATEIARANLALQQDKALADTDLTRAQTQLAISQARRLEGQVGPPFPGGSSSGDVRIGPHGAFEFKPTEVIPHHPGDRSTVGGPANPVVKFGWSSNGALQIFANDKLISDQEIENPFMIRWLITDGFPSGIGATTEKHARTVMAHIKSEYPKAIGYEFDPVKVGYVPVFTRSQTSRDRSGSLGDTRFDLHRPGRGMTAGHARMLGYPKGGIRSQF